MKVLSVNIGQATTILWNNKEEQTGIFKYPVSQSIFLNSTDVSSDSVIDRVHHAGINKACYLFSADNYLYWKELYPDLQWNWGMFGENLTIEGLDESTMRIGDVYKIGDSIVQISQPREPCYKLGIRFKTQEILRQFINHKRPGTYVRILKEGKVQKGDQLELQEQSENKLTVQQFYELLFERNKSKIILNLFMQNKAVPQYKKDKFKKYL